MNFMRKLLSVVLCLWILQTQAAEDKKASSADTTTKSPILKEIETKQPEVSPSPRKELKELLDMIWWDEYRRRKCVT